MSIAGSALEQFIIKVMHLLAKMLFKNPDVGIVDNNRY